MATQEQRKAETRSLLIDAAADLFARKGFHAVSAEAVADAADRTTGALVSGDPDNLTETVEIWTFLRRNGGDWKVSAIQGVENA